MKFQEGGDGDSNHFVRLKDKEWVKGIFRGELSEFKKHWANGKTEFCTGAANCPYCVEGNKPSFRFRLNLITVDPSGGYVAKIFEQGWVVYCQLRDLNKDYPLEKTIVKITRSGTNMNDTSYSILPVPNGAVTAEIESKIKSVPLQDVSPLPKAPTETPAQTRASEQTPMTEDDIPF